MAENKAEIVPHKRWQVSIPPAAFVIVVVVAAGLAALWYLSRPAPTKAAPPLTGPAKAYVRNLRLANVDMQRHESYLHQSVVEITGTIENAGDRVLRSVEINCVFYDPFGQVVLRERVPIVSPRMNGLAPAEIKKFRLAFDNVPEGWNQIMPQMVIAAIDFS